ncbi:DUF4214 domain-containing protein [Pararhizobium haloflavum]|uniref:DUF4214 domain-containing protein n=1 Tax=Pararhizobium haloflavum TaxID=2037914 RepID=UPI0018E4C3FE|nr:DUF4214 domain-containing protein [Pararhizobium haloflavum]
MAIDTAKLGSLGEAYNLLLDADAFFKVNLTTLNNSGATGGALIAIDSDAQTLTVLTTGKGVEAGQPHPQHIHGFAVADDGSVQNSVSPTLDQDADGDGVVELAEAAGQYGPILLSLSDPQGGEIPDFPTPAGDSFVQTTTYDLDTLNPDDLRLSEQITADNLTAREIVLHGRSLDGSQGMGTEGEADGTPGYKAVLPIASGEIFSVRSEDVLTDLTDGRIAVSNDIVALDIQGNAGQAYRLYEAVLGRMPDQQGLTFWVDRLDGGEGLVNVADALLNSDEFTANFGDNDMLSDDAFVDVMYQNVLGRDADASGEAYWTGVLDDGTSRAKVLASFSESDENQMAVLGQIENGILLDATVVA